MADFTNIMILAEDIGTSLIAAEKASELCETAETTIYLVKVLQKESLFTKLSAKFSGRKNVPVRKRRLAEKKELSALKKKMLTHTGFHRIVCNVLIVKNAKKNLQKYFTDKNIHLLILAGNDTTANSHLSKQDIYGNLSEQMDIPVLAVFNDSDRHITKSILLRSILLPVSGAVPEKKIQATLSIARKLGAQIHIVTVLNDNKTEMKQQVDAFYFTYKMLCEYGYTPHYKILSGNGKTALMLNYAKQVRAGMILLNVPDEPGLGMRARLKLAEILHPFSVMPIKPYQVMPE